MSRKATHGGNHRSAGSRLKQFFFRQGKRAAAMNTATSPDALVTRKTSAATAPLHRRPTLLGPTARRAHFGPQPGRAAMASPGLATRSAPWDGALQRARLAKGDDQEFLQLLAAYRVTGGVAPGAEIAARRAECGLSELARLIAGRKVLSFDWHATTWLPVFQFETGQIAVRRDVGTVLEELASELDGWELAQWFVQPSALLSGRAPLAVLQHDAAAVVEAARADRFLLRG
jgi:hypothetical protein